jgi:hypothetical protein
VLVHDIFPEGFKRFLPCRSHSIVVTACFCLNRLPKERCCAAFCSRHDQPEKVRGQMPA